MSPIIFNIALEPVIRAATGRLVSSSYSLAGQRLNIVAFADDLTLLTDGDHEMRELLRTVGTAAGWAGLNFNASKCATLHSDHRHSVETEFFIQDSAMTILGEGEAYRQLGILPGLRAQQTPLAEIEKLTVDLAKIDASPLAPWQKLDAMRTFLQPRLEFII